MRSYAWADTWYPHVVKQLHGAREMVQESEVAVHRMFVRAHDDSNACTTSPQLHAVGAVAEGRAQSTECSAINPPQENPSAAIFVVSRLW
jgi:hypothetical protein